MSVIADLINLSVNRKTGTVKLQLNWGDKKEFALLDLIAMLISGLKFKDTAFANTMLTVLITFVKANEEWLAEIFSVLKAVDLYGDPVFCYQIYKDLSRWSI